MLFTTCQASTLHIRNGSGGKCGHGDYHCIMTYLGIYQGIFSKPAVVSGSGKAKGGRKSWFLRHLAIQK